jgi:ornithine racemase
VNGSEICIDLPQIGTNASRLVARLGHDGITVTAVTKAVLGRPDIACSLLGAGVSRLGDSRVENLERLRAAGIDAPMVLLRSPMVSQVDRVVRTADVSMNTEPTVLRALSHAAGAVGRRHGVILMIELGDLREGIDRADLAPVVDAVLSLPHLSLTGIGTNLACRSGIEPDDRNMGELSAIADGIEAAFGVALEVVSGGNSANLDWCERTTDVGRVNDLRLGESILLGCEPLHRRPIPGLGQDAFTISGEVLESMRKQTVPSGDAAQAAFGEPTPVEDRGEIWQTIVALGRQDIEPDGLTPPTGVRVLAASSDHLMLETPARVLPGERIEFRPDYGTLVRAMTSPFVTKTVSVDPGA